MLIDTLLIVHIAVLGYWLGAELIINSTYRYVAWSSSMPFAERDRLMDHVLNVDQHVRYALLLQITLGITLAALIGYLPGGKPLALVVAALAVIWLGLVEITHRRRKLAEGERLASIDRTVRYTVILVLLALSINALNNEAAMPDWLAWKLILFGGVIACGVAIRLTLIRFYRVWHVIEEVGFDAQCEMRIRQIYIIGTSILGVLWLCIAGIVGLSVWKP